ncbi:hypothetical protein NQ315_014396 [Exocentrus adspersus]|uniref:Uncharacterized protein n=1 Tax=Exocentrus adspersus TaxID=1586481 RepID=A0AAV8VF70_9CUCU|nr:hypothetical protein NQ315_014396 [Exocentrus adspersus]
MQNYILAISSTVAESYIEDSISNKLDIARKVQGESNVTRSENDGNNPTRVVINGKEVAYEKTKNEMCITINLNWHISISNVKQGVGLNLEILLNVYGFQARR